MIISKSVFILFIVIAEIALKFWTVSKIYRTIFWYFTNILESLAFTLAIHLKCYRHLPIKLILKNLVFILWILWILSLLIGILQLVLGHILKVWVRLKWLKLFSSPQIWNILRHSISLMNEKLSILRRI